MHTPGLCLGYILWNISLSFLSTPFIQIYPMLSPLLPSTFIVIAKIK